MTEKERKKIVVFGSSLGGAVAIDLVSKNDGKIGGLIIENTFLSIPKLASDISPLLRPLIPSIHQIFDSATAIKSIKCPTLFLSGLKDNLIPPAHMEKLKDLSESTRKDFRTYPESGHNNNFSSKDYFPNIVEFLGSI